MAASESLAMQLSRSGVPCRELASWVSCYEGRRTDCEHCHMDGPARCQYQLVEALVERIITAVQQTDAVLAQRDYWKGVADRICNAVIERRRAEDV